MHKIFILLVPAISVSCHKKSTHTDDAPNVVITIQEPVLHQIYHKDDTLWVRGSAANTSELHGYEVTIRNTNTNQYHLDQGYHTHGSSFTFEEFWKVHVSDTNVLEVEIKVDADHSGNFITKKVQVTAYPQ